MSNVPENDVLLLLPPAVRNVVPSAMVPPPPSDPTVWLALDSDKLAPAATVRLVVGAIN
jgi:hypothetical protein